MTGSPPFQAIAVAIGLGCVAYPMVKLTSDEASGASVPVPSTPVQSTASTSASLRLQMAHQPKSLKLTHEGKSVYEMSQPGLTCEGQISVPISSEGLELVIEAQWEPETPDTPVTVTISPDGLEDRSATAWSVGAEMQGIVHFSWK